MSDLNINRVNDLDKLKMVLAENADLRKQLSERNEFLAEIKKLIQEYESSKPIGLAMTLKDMVEDPSWPSSSSSRSSTKEEPTHEEMKGIFKEDWKPKP